MAKEAPYIISATQDLPYTQWRANIVNETLEIKDETD